MFSLIMFLIIAYFTFKLMFSREFWIFLLVVLLIVCIPVFFPLAIFFGVILLLLTGQ